MAASSNIGKEFVDAATTLHKFITASPTHSSAVPARSSIAKTLTHFLFSEIELPSILSGDYGNIIKAFTSGVATGSALWYFFLRYQTRRERIQFAMFHLIRLCEKMSPEDSQRFRANPDIAVAEMQQEVLRMTASQITRAEGKAVISQYKRKVWDDFEAEMVQRRLRRKMREVAAVNLSTVRKNTDRLYALRAKISNATTQMPPRNRRAPAHHRPQEGSHSQKHRGNEGPANSSDIAPSLQRNTSENRPRSSPDLTPISDRISDLSSSTSSDDGSLILLPRDPIPDSRILSRHPAKTAQNDQGLLFPVAEDDDIVEAPDHFPPESSPSPPHSPISGENSPEAEAFQQITTQISHMQREIQKAQVQVNAMAGSLAQPDDAASTSTSTSTSSRPPRAAPEEIPRPELLQPVLTPLPRAETGQRTTTTATTTTTTRKSRTKQSLGPPGRMVATPEPRRSARITARRSRQD